MIVGHKSTTFCRNSQTFSFNFCLQPPPPVLRPAPPASPPLRQPSPPLRQPPSSVYSLKLITKMKIADTRLWSGKPSRREGLPSPCHRHPSSPSSGPSHPAKGALSSTRRSPFVPPFGPRDTLPNRPGTKKGGTPVLPPLPQRYNKNARNANARRISFTPQASPGHGRAPSCRAPRGRHSACPHARSPRIFHPEGEHALRPVAALAVKAHGPAAKLHAHDAHLIGQPGTVVGGIDPARTALLGTKVLP